MKMVLDKNHIGIINYESARKLPQVYLGHIGFLILDESQRCRSQDSLTTKFFIGPPNGKSIGLADLVPYRLIMTGTPAPNSPIEYWGQMAVVDKKILGNNFYVFRASNFYAGGFCGYQWKVRSDRKDWIMDQVKSKAFYISKDECLDLPDQIFTHKTFQMSKDLQLAYDSMKKENLLSLKGATVLGIVELAKIMKLRQITSGFVIDQQGKAHKLSDDKFKLLDETLDEIGHDKQVIIWCQFHYEIQELMLRLGDKVCALYGDMTQAAKEASIKDFIAGKRTYLVAHPKTGGVGLTFTNCSYNVYFSMDYSYESFKQSQDRTHRIGQSKKVTYISLLAEDTIDGIIYKALTKKQDISQTMLRMINNE